MADADDPIEVLIVISEDHRDDADGVVSRLRAAGVENMNVLPLIGVITGRLRRSQRASAAKVEGVASVEGSSVMQILESDSSE